MLSAQANVLTVYVALLEEGVPCWRPTQAIYFGDGAYRILPTSDFDRADEEWAFEPGSVVDCEEVQDAGSVFLRAISLHPIQPKSLIGKRLSGATRAGAMAMFSFGEVRPVETSRGPKPAAEYALHPQCAWRITAGEAVLIGSSDLYRPADGRDDQTDFDWDQPGASRLDVRMRELLEGDLSLVVENFEFGRAGAISIALGQDRHLEVFPNNSLDEEYWRLFRPGTNYRHLVIGAL
jgi:hypothetical protein